MCLNLRTQTIDFARRRLYTVHAQAQAVSTQLGICQSREKALLASDRPIAEDLGQQTRYLVSSWREENRDRERLAVLGSGEVTFDTAFQALTDFRPLRWQRRLFDMFMTSRIPEVCDIPTGLGKTAVIPIWTIALAFQAEQRAVKLPRRLVYVVDRRTVVDQATNVVETMRERLRRPDDSRWKQH